jgi:hypothetical protein
MMKGRFGKVEFDLDPDDPAYLDNQLDNGNR